MPTFIGCQIWGGGITVHQNKTQLVIGIRSISFTNIGISLKVGFHGKDPCKFLNISYKLDFRVLWEWKKVLSQGAQMLVGVKSLEIYIFSLQSIEIQVEILHLKQYYRYKYGIYIPLTRIRPGYTKEDTTCLSKTAKKYEKCRPKGHKCLLG